MVVRFMQGDLAVIYVTRRNGTQTFWGETAKESSGRAAIDFNHPDPPRVRAVDDDQDC